MDTDQLSRKLAVILHADVVGSTALVQQNEQLAHERIRDSFRRFGGIISQYHGHVRELRGDALLAEFDRASDAISAALSFQGENAEFNATLDDDIQPQLRVGISLGEVVIADGTVTGAGVVLAQRVEQLAEAGGICITGAIYEAAPRHLPVSYTDLGRQQLKGFEQPVLVYQAGVKTSEPVKPADSASSHKMSATSRAGHLPVIGSIAALIAIVAVIVAWQPWRTESGIEPASTAPGPRSDTPAIAVLAFDNLSGDPNQEYVSDGISDSIINALSNFPDFHVIARQSTFSYKGKAMKVQQIADELGVDYVLQGSVQKSAGRMRVNAQLVDATKGHQIWSQQYDRESEDIFALQDDITQHIVANIGSNQGPIAKSIWTRIQREAPADLRAYDYWQLGRAHFFLVTKEDNAKARSYFQKAVEVDPNYSLGHAWLAWTYHVDVTFGWSAESNDLLDKAFHHAQRAVALDNSEADAHWVFASVNALVGGRPEVSQSEYEIALSLNPNSADLIAEYGWSLPSLGRAADGIEHIKKAMRLNPFFPDWYGEGLIHALYVAGRYQEAIAFSSRIRIRTISNYLDLAGSYAQLGQLDAARETAAKVLELKPDFSIEWWRERIFFKNPADLEHYLEGLYKAGLPEIN